MVYQNSEVIGKSLQFSLPLEDELEIGNNDPTSHVRIGPDSRCTYTRNVVGNFFIERHIRAMLTIVFPSLYCRQYNP